MKRKIIKIGISAMLAIALTFSFAGFGIAEEAQQTPTADAAQASKTEVVYATLLPGGEPDAVYVVNQFEVSGAGTVTDHGDYKSVMNLTDTGAISLQGEQVSFYADTGMFYYQGDMGGAALPWVFDVTYLLDGQETAPVDLAGKTGDLTIRIITRQSDNGSVFYNNYMLQISVTLDNEKCIGINAPGATVASAGQDTTVTYIVMPGKDADLTLSAAVSDFEMDGITAAGMPMSFDIDLPDTQGMTDDMGALADAIGELYDGVDALCDGASELKDAVYELKSGSYDIRQGLRALSGNAAQLETASEQIADALTQISASLGGELGEMDFGDMAQLPAALSEISGGLTGVSGGLGELKDNFTAAYAALDTAISGIPDEALTPEQIGALYAGTDEALIGDLDTLVAYYYAGQAVKATYSQVKPAFDAVGPAIESVCGSIDTMAAALADMAEQMQEAAAGLDAISGLDQLATGLTTLADQYAAFHGGLTGYLDGVTQISGGYTDFHSGLGEYADGMSGFYDGAVELRDGTSELNDETADLPDEVQTMIDEWTAEYSGDEFVPVSFTSPLNTDIRLVQFVMKLGGIEKPESEDTGDDTTGDSETVWDRIANLFGG